MTPDEQLSIAINAASEYKAERNAQRDAQLMGRLGCTLVRPDWKAPDMGHILAALRALGLLPVEERPPFVPYPGPEVDEDLRRAVHLAYQAAAIQMRPSAIPEALRAAGFKIVRV